MRRTALKAVVPAALTVDRRIVESTRPFRRTDLFRPHTTSRRWAWTHYGIFLPDLPEPYRFANVMTLIGATGSVVFDDDTLAASDARLTTTLLSSTAYAEQRHHRGYDAVADCDFSDDGGVLRWGEDLRIVRSPEAVVVEGTYAGFAISIELAPTDTVSWFVRAPYYDHLSLLAPYTATIRDERGTTTVEGLGTVEYARCLSPQAFSRRPLPMSLKLPVDLFTYQILNLDPDTQLLLTDVQALGTTACRLAHLRHRDGRAEVYDDVRFEVTGWDERTDPHGRAMRVPNRLRWDVPGLVTFEAEVDAPYRFGHGRGYVSAYTYAGAWRDREITGSGYLEWVDCRRMD